VSPDLQTNHSSISATQVRLIHIGIAELGIDDDTYRMMLARYGVDTCKDLQYSQASAFIDDLVKKGFKIKRRLRPRRPNNPKLEYLPNHQQLSIIEHLRRDVQWRVHDGYHRWVEKFLGRTYIRTSREAQKVIEALKAMKSRQQQEFLKRCKEADTRKYPEPDGEIRP
jgi:hypothetical protein